MPNKHKSPLVGWHPAGNLTDRLRAAIEKRGGTKGLKTLILNQALRDWLDRNENGEDPK